MFVAVGACFEVAAGAGVVCGGHRDCACGDQVSASAGRNNARGEGGGSRHKRRPVHRTTDSDAATQCGCGDCVVSGGTAVTVIACVCAGQCGRSGLYACVGARFEVAAGAGVAGGIDGHGAFRRYRVATDQTGDGNRARHQAGHIHGAS